MRECCKNCKNRLKGIKSDHTKLGSGEEIDTPMEGFICLELAYEGVAFHMVGIDENIGMCEMYIPKDAIR